MRSEALTWFATNGFDDGVTSVDIVGNSSVEPPTIGKAPTEFTGLSYDGNPISLADYAGQPLWLTIGASWRPDCRVEAADLEDTYEANRDNGLSVLAIFINDPPADIRDYVRRAGLTFPIIADQAAAIGGAYRLVGRGAARGDHRPAGARRTTPGSGGGLTHPLLLK